MLLKENEGKYWSIYFLASLWTKLKGEVHKLEKIKKQQKKRNETSISPVPYASLIKVHCYGSIPDSIAHFYRRNTGTTKTKITFLFRHAVEEIF